MAKTSLQWGLLSTARINRALINPLKFTKRGKLAAVASRSQERAEAYAREHSIPRSYGSYEALLADPEIDAVYISLPNSLHAEWTIKAVQAGKHVLCEKPLAITVAEVDAVRAAAGAAGRLVMEAFMFRHHPQTIKVKELVDGGAIGALRVINGTFTYFLTRPGDVRLVPELGGGALWDIGCYPVSYARAVLGLEPEEVFGWQITGPTGIDEVFTGQMRFPGANDPQGNPVFCQFVCGFRIAHRSRMEFCGTEGTLTVPLPFIPGKRTTLLLERDGQVEKIPVKGQELYLGQVENMAEAVLDGKPPRVSLEDSRNNTAALVALLESARTGLPVRV